MVAGLEACAATGCNTEQQKATTIRASGIIVTILIIAMILVILIIGILIIVVTCIAILMFPAYVCGRSSS